MADRVTGTVVGTVAGTVADRAAGAVKMSAANQVPGEATDWAAARGTPCTRVKAGLGFAPRGISP